MGVWWTDGFVGYTPATEAECVGSNYNGTWDSGLSRCTTLWQFPAQSWVWDTTNRVWRMDLPFRSGLNLTIAIPGSISYGGSNFTASLSQSGIGQWFYVIMMSLPPLMVYVRTASIGPASLILMFSIWAYGVFAPMTTGNVLLPDAGFWLGYTFLAVSIAIVIYRLLKKG